MGFKISKKGRVSNQDSFGTIFAKDKKGMGSVVATALIIVVAVVAVMGFQSWFGSYQTGLNVKAEGSGTQSLNTQIETMIGNTIFVKNSYDSLTVNSVKVDGQDCNVTDSLNNGIDTIDVSFCLETLEFSTNTPEVVIVTDKGVFSKTIFLKGDNYTYSSISTLEGVFLDSPVGGLEYFTSSKNGFTSANGGFSYENGEIISFYVGNAYLGSTLAKPIITPADLGGGYNTQYTINLARFLQSSDDDNNLSNGINISNLVLNNISGKSIDFNLNATDFEINVSGIVTLSISQQDAIDHLVNSVAQINTNMPNSFHFNDVADVDLNTTIISNTLIPSGYEGILNVSIYGDGTPQLKINEGDWVTNANINPSDNITIRLTSGNEYENLRNITLILGDYSVDWRVMTKKEPFCEGVEVYYDVGTGICWDTNMYRFMYKTWSEAVNVCNNLNHAGYDDWRLPTRTELYGKTCNDFPSAYGFNCNTLGKYWTGTQYDSYYAWYVYFNGGTTTTALKTTASGFIATCVRSK